MRHCICALKRMKHRKMVLEELAATERTYCEQLGVMVNTFYIPMRDERILDQAELRGLFSEIQSIYQTNNVFSGLFETAVRKNGYGLGHELQRVIAFLKCYTQYVNNYSNAIQTHARLIKTNSKFKNFLKKAYKSIPPHLQGYSFHSFLILPVQRIPRYEMLFREICKYTPRDNPEYPDFERSFHKFKEMAEYINTRKRESEQSEKVVEIQNRLRGDFPNLITPGRHLLCEGTLHRMVDGKFIELNHFVFNDAILFARQRRGKLTYMDMLMLDGCRIVDQMRDLPAPACNQVRLHKGPLQQGDTEQELLLGVTDGTQFDALCSTIQRNVEELLKNRLSFAGVNLPDASRSSTPSLLLTPGGLPAGTTPTRPRTIGPISTRQ
eukprot:gnl/Trimastix_PCT/3119.p1 GENE.gnl/Trimastix_PCT/3119~~gnl/Trimastix_PCT/3119.p1  ORF type:complete len:381 (-),score=96.83 gnl/Trimastix_PCT/3119:142-1284(-)